MYNRKLGQPPIHLSVLCKVLLFAMIPIKMGVAKLSELCIDDGTSPDKLPPRLANLTSRRTMMNEVLEQLRDMDARRKAEGFNAKVPVAGMLWWPTFEFMAI